ncbi:exonuclease domain-containing protein [Aureimonas sp. N4]|uniref:exonuclease domain-containing protein n=1 Tax=Aureimonas sp. N4 TaxID=1638165 RepID=UPI000782AD67|nr:exonuclease domain-containing protein [Aureimonas sp. N4]
MSSIFPPAPITPSLFPEARSFVVRVIDTETAGHKLEEDAVIEIGSVDLDLANGRIFHSMQTMADPAGVEINPHARRVHKITDEMLKGAPPFAEAVRPFAEATIFAAQRASFDRSRLRLAGTWLCTYKLALRAFPDVRAHGLQSLVKYVPLDLSDVEAELQGLHPHRALFDALCTAVLLRRITAELLPRCRDLTDFLERAERVSNEPALLARLRFGRYRNAALRDVPSDYLEWLVREPGMDADAVYTARHHLQRRADQAVAAMARPLPAA